MTIAQCTVTAYVCGSLRLRQAFDDEVPFGDANDWFAVFVNGQPRIYEPRNWTKIRKEWTLGAVVCQFRGYESFVQKWTRSIPGLRRSDLDSPLFVVMPLLMRNGEQIQVRLNFGASGDI